MLDIERVLLLLINEAVKVFLFDAFIAFVSCEKHFQGNLISQLEEMIEKQVWVESLTKIRN